MEKNKGTLGLVMALVLFVGMGIGMASIRQANAAASLAETANWSTNDGLERLPVTIKWPISTDTTYLLSLPSNYGIPIAYQHIQFQDQNLPAGGDAGSGTGKVAEELENTFVAVEEYGGSGISANQITVYRQEYDGTAPTQESVVSYGEFIFAPIELYFAPAL